MSLLNCPECGHQVSDRAKSCPNCGLPLRPTHDRTLAIIGLIINVIFWPGLGTVIGGDVGFGAIQMAFYSLGWILTFTIIGAIIGIPLFIAMWIWALVSSIRQLSRTA